MLFGSGPDLSVLQMGCRAAVIFVLALALIRVAGRRSFGMHSAFDNVITLLLGAVLARAVVGASPLLPTVAAAAVIVLLHRIFAWLAVRSHGFGFLLKGDPIAVYQHGEIIPKHLYRSLMSRRDLMEEIRVRLNRDSFTGIDRIYVERSGEVGIIMTNDGFDRERGR
ncbi:MAG: DUF421 domain-containing protein [Gemmatimonadales bacterium]